MKFENIDQLDEGKLYTVELRDGRKVLVFRDEYGIRSNAQYVQERTNVKGEPITRYKEENIVSFEEFAK